VNKKTSEGEKGEDYNGYGGNTAKQGKGGWAKGWGGKY